jgi:uncharacterized protein YihD (DUF1040 family)
MRDVKRIDPLLNLIKKEWVKTPDLRLGQLLYTVCWKNGVSLDEKEIFNIEDDELYEFFEFLNK